MCLCVCVSVWLSAAVSEDGSLYACGYNSRGQLGQGDTSLVTVPKLVEGLHGKRVVQVACSYYHTAIGTAAGEVYTFGASVCVSVFV